MRSEIERLKKKARRHYLAHQSAVADMSCGASLAAHMRRGVSEDAAAFNEAMRRLSEIDPSCPAFEPLPV